MALASPSISPSLDTTKLSRNDNWLLIPSERRRGPRSGSRYHILDPSTELDTFTHTHTHSHCHRAGQACRTLLLAFWCSFFLWKWWYSAFMSDGKLSLGASSPLCYKQLGRVRQNTTALYPIYYADDDIFRPLWPEDSQQWPKHVVVNIINRIQDSYVLTYNTPSLTDEKLIPLQFFTSLTKKRF